MPTYEYRCAACHREFEVQQRMSDPDLVHCDACGADKLERLISWTSVRNDGWKAAMHAPNPKEAFKGISAVDRSRGKRFSGNATPEPATTEPAAPASPAPADEPVARPAPALDAETVEDDD